MDITCHYSNFNLIGAVGRPGLQGYPGQNVQGQKGTCAVLILSHKHKWSQIMTHNILILLVKVVPDRLDLLAQMVSSVIVERQD